MLWAPHSTPGTEDSEENRIDKATEVSLKLTWQDERDKQLNKSVISQANNEL